MILMKIVGKQLAPIVLVISLVCLSSCVFADQIQANNTEGKLAKKHNSPFTEGPHIFYKKGKVFVKNIHFTSTGTEVEEQLFDTKQSVPELTCTVDNKQNTTFKINLQEKYIKPETVYPQPKKLFAISDIEGNFEAFEQTLLGNGVINEDLNWSYGKGHLVLVGDFFDRGHNVTPVLWLIYQLEQQAQKAGGMVHFIIGNHEEMNMRGDQRYVKDRYIKTAKALRISFQNLYSENTELGRWLRSKNVIEKIGKTIFVHGGLSPQMAMSRIRLEEMNKYARQYYGMDKFRLDQKGGAASAVFSKTGPMWYRGYFREKLSQKEIDQTLNLYGAKYVVVGHTIVPKVSSLHQGKIIAIDVKHDIALKDKVSNSICFENGKLYATNVNGKRMAIEVFMTEELIVDVFKAVKRGNLPLVKSFLNEGDKAERLNKHYFSKRITLLQAAIYHNQPEIVRMLILEGANINMLSENKTPLMHAIEQNNPNILDILIMAGADINALNKQKKSPLFYCAKHGTVAIAKVLVDNGAKLDLKDGKGRTAMEYAIKNDNDKVAIFLKNCNN